MASGPNISPMCFGRFRLKAVPVNLGEVLPTGSKDKNEMTVTTNLQAFGLIVTAEPYFAVTMPSDLVVTQNVVVDKTQGVIEQVNAHYSLLPRGAYAETAGRHAVLHPITRNERSPLELYEAENAVQIADAAGAEQYAGDTMKTAKTALAKRGGPGHKQERSQADHYICARSGAVGRRRAHHHDPQDQGRRRCRTVEGSPGCRTGGASSASEPLSRHRQQRTSRQPSAHRLKPRRPRQKRGRRKLARSSRQPSRQRNRQAQQTEQMRERLEDSS